LKSAVEGAGVEEVGYALPEEVIVGGAGAAEVEVEGTQGTDVTVVGGCG
jgi:hypothetical protein